MKRPKFNLFKKYDMRLYNYGLLVLVLIASVFGLVIINSVDSTLTVKQAMGMIAALVWMVFLSFVDFEFIVKRYRLLYLILIIMLVLVLLVGKSAGGATRWLGTDSLRLQPSELGKIILILFLAQLLYYKRNKLDSWKFLFILAIILALPLGLIVIEPDLSQTILITCVMIIMIFVGDIPYKKVWKILAVVIPVAIVLFIYVQNPDQKLLKPYQWKRVMAFIDPDQYDDNVYQQKYAVEAIGSGGLTGKGIGNDDPTSLLDSNYIAEAHTDFVFAALGEQLGFVGCVSCIAVIAAIVFMCVRVAVKTDDYRGRLISIGVASYIGLQTFLNIGVVTKLLPNTGLALPFFSYGLSSLVTLYTAMGIVLNISLQTRSHADKDMFSKAFVNIEEYREDEKKAKRVRL